MLICTEASPDMKQRFEAAGCPVVAVGRMARGIDYSRIAAAASALRTFRPHIVHGAVFEGVIMAALGGRLAGVPIIIGEETSHPTTRRWRGHAYYRALVAITHQMVVVAPAVADYLTETLRVPRAKARLILNGVREAPPATEAEIAAVREQFDVSPSDFVIGAVGRLAAPSGHAPDSNKRISDAITAVARILKICPRARLLIVGSGPDQEFLRKLAAEKNLQESVIFAGYQPNTRPFYEIMDVLVHPSASEALPLVLVEAMFARLPVVATNVGGIPVVVEHGRTGFLVQPLRPEKLVERILQLWNDPELRERMGTAGLERARQHFSEERYVGDVASLYEELVERRLGQRAA